MSILSRFKMSESQKFIAFCDLYWTRGHLWTACYYLFECSVEDGWRRVVTYCWVHSKLSSSLPSSWWESSWHHSFQSFKRNVSTNFVDDGCGCWARLVLPKSSKKWKLCKPEERWILFTNHSPTNDNKLHDHYLSLHLLIPRFGSNLFNTRLTDRLVTSNCFFITSRIGRMIIFLAIPKGFAKYSP